MAKDAKIVNYRRPLKLNIGIIIFLIMFLYILFSAYTYSRRDKVNFYEVTEGGMAKNTEHVGIAIREEHTQVADRSGYVNLFVGSGKRVSVGSEVYSLDETGAMTSFLSSEITLQESIGEENIQKLKKQLMEFSREFQEASFHQVYDTRNLLNSAVLEYANDSMFQDMEELMKKSGIRYERVTSPYAGVISYDIDGYENRTAESIGAADFEKKDYVTQHIKSGQLVEKDFPVYRVVTSENWDLVFPVSEEERKQYSENNALKIRFRNQGITCTVPYTQMNSSDGNAYGKLSLSRYMVDFINDRFVSFDIVSPGADGLKIPGSAVVTKTFLTVPEAYLARGGDDVDEGFYKEVLTENGAGIRYIPTEIYYHKDGVYYIDFSSTAEFQPGDYVIQPGTNERYKLGATANLEGVYNINKGYAVFKQIEVLEYNDEFYTVQRNQKYGLSVYDHILFDPEGYHEGDFIYQ